jgi:heavy metal sensor kinase
LDLGLYYGFKRVLHTYVDSRLEAMALTWAEIISNNAGVWLASLEQQDTTQFLEGPHIAEPNADHAVSIRVLSLEGNALWESAPILPPGLRNAPIPAGITEGRRVFETIQIDSQPAVRRVWSPIHYQGEIRYILQAETAMRLMQNALTWLQVMLAMGSAAVLVLAWLGSRWLAHQALIPVHALTRTAQDIAETSSLVPRLELDASHVEFRRLAEVFNTMMDRLQRAFEGQRRFVTDAAHELHTPLTAMKGNLEVAFACDRTAKEYRETLISNFSAVERLIQLCRSLIILARLSGEQVPPAKTHLSLEPLLREVVDELKVLAEDRHVWIHMNAGWVPDVYGNKEQLQRVFVNLLDNALRHTPPWGTVTATLAATKTHVLFIISDTGEGIAEEHLPHIFERFYRADSARSRDSGGVGLGLAIVEEIIKNHGGEVTVESRVNEGTRFRISLPIVNARRPGRAGHSDTQIAQEERCSLNTP